jgi:hypothetical protein
LKTTPIPVKFDRQGHSCNFYGGLGPTIAVVRAEWLLNQLAAITDLKVILSVKHCRNLGGVVSKQFAFAS